MAAPILHPKVERLRSHSSFKRQLIAMVLTFTIPLWIVPLILFVAMSAVYRWVYEGMCMCGGEDDDDG